jgi:hypothetical protein
MVLEIHDFINREELEQCKDRYNFRKFQIYWAFLATFSSTRRKLIFYTYKIVFLRVGVNAP